MFGHVWQMSEEELIARRSGFARVRTSTIEKTILSFPQIRGLYGEFREIVKDWLARSS
jgi:hypothetical protein